MSVNSIQKGAFWNLYHKGIILCSKYMKDNSNLLLQMRNLEIATDPNILASTVLNSSYRPRPLERLSGVANVSP